MDRGIIIDAGEQNRLIEKRDSPSSEAIRSDHRFVSHLDGVIEMGDEGDRGGALREKLDEIFRDAERIGHCHAAVDP